MSITPLWWTLQKNSIGDNCVAEETTSSAIAACCGLCVHNCTIDPGKAGYCGARFFDGQELHSPYLGRFSSVAIDPIEKKPLYHWRPGSVIFSLGSIGCTMRCPFCQNHGIAQPTVTSESLLPKLHDLTPSALVEALRLQGLNSVAYTYNEPALQAEYILEAAPVLRKAGVATVLVSNGMYSEEVLKDFAQVVDAVNIDLKTFNAKTYARLGGSFEAVKRTIQTFVEAGVHVEVTTLVVPGVSDDEEEFAAELDWLAALSPWIPLHISRYHPAHRFKEPSTPISLLQEFASMAKQKLRHVHIGNVPGLH